MFHTTTATEAVTTAVSTQAGTNTTLITTAIGTQTTTLNETIEREGLDTASAVNTLATTNTNHYHKCSGKCFSYPWCTS